MPVGGSAGSGRAGGSSLAGHTVVGGGRAAHGARAADHVPVVERPKPYFGRVVSITDEPTAYGGIYDPSALNRRLAVPPPRHDDESDAGSIPAPPPLPMRQVVTRTRVTTKKKVKRKTRRSSSTKRQGGPLRFGESVCGVGRVVCVRLTDAASAQRGRAARVPEHALHLRQHPHHSRSRTHCVSACRPP